MNHSFDIDHARQFGIEEAIMIQNFMFWISKNKANGVNFYEGRTWTFNSTKALSTLFPYMTGNTIRRTLEKLVDSGLLLKGNFNKTGTDRTNWYGFSDESILENSRTELAKMPNVMGEKASSIPDINTDSKPDIEHRQKAFVKKLTPFLEIYGKETLNDFYNYWTEHNEDGKKMRFEKQDPFNIKRRLITWKRNQDARKPVVKTQDNGSPVVSKSVFDNMARFNEDR